jgi:hypothetical protein
MQHGNSARYHARRQHGKVSALHMLLPPRPQASVINQMSEYYLAGAFLNAIDAEEQGEFGKQAKTYYAADKEMLQDMQALYSQNGTISADAREWNQGTDVRVKLQPAIQGWTLQQVSLVRTDITSPERSSTTYNDTEEGAASNGYQQAVLVYTITYRRSTFTQLFAVAIVIIMWILSIYLLVLAVDHVIVRRRPLEPDTVGYSVGMLFALPALRLLLYAPFGRWAGRCCWPLCWWRCMTWYAAARQGVYLQRVLTCADGGM